MTEDIKLEVPLCDQYDNAHDESWAYRMCAPCSLWMLLKHRDPDFGKTPTNLRDELVAQGGYLENIGFKHAALAALGQQHGLGLDYARKFFYSSEEKEEGMKLINQNLKNEQPVVVSMYSHHDPARSSHLVVIHGAQIYKERTIGYYIQSSDATFRGHNYFVPHDEFVANWRGGLIYQSKPAA